MIKKIILRFTNDLLYVFDFHTEVTFRLKHYKIIRRVPFVIKVENILLCIINKGNLFNSNFVRNGSIEILLDSYYKKQQMSQAASVVQR
jgi:hypothetical protein